MKPGYTITVARYGRVRVLSVAKGTAKPFECRYLDSEGESRIVWLSERQLLAEHRKRNRKTKSNSRACDYDRMALVELRQEYGVETYKEPRRFVCGHKAYRGRPEGECLECVMLRKKQVMMRLEAR